MTPELSAISHGRPCLLAVCGTREAAFRRLAHRLRLGLRLTVVAVLREAPPDEKEMRTKPF